MSVAEGILRKLLDKIIEELQYSKNAEISLKELTSGGANYTSALYSATVNAPDRDTLKLFAKVANVSGHLREAMNLDVLFKTEQFVYADLSKMYEKIQDKHDVSPEHRFVFPKFYGGKSTEGEETVVMEDLMTKGYGTYSRFQSIDWEHAASALECLAKFHALSFAYRKEDPQNFAKDAEELKCVVTESEDPATSKTWERMVENAVNAVKEEHKDTLLKFLASDTSRSDFFKYRMPLSTTVLCHGDYRVSNLLFRRLNGRLEPIVVDYQTVHSGCPTSDLLYLEFLGTDEAFRKENHERMVEHYFKELTKALDRVGLDVNEVYPRETFDKELKEMMANVLRVSMVILPLVLVEPNLAPSMGAMKEIEEFSLSPSQVFAERFNGLVSDCVRWGVI